LKEVNSDAGRVYCRTFSLSAENFWQIYGSLQAISKLAFQAQTVEIPYLSLRRDLLS